jgi:hypothetical protein
VNVHPKKDNRDQATEQQLHRLSPSTRETEAWRPIERIESLARERWNMNPKKSGVQHGPVMWSEFDERYRRKRKSYFESKQSGQDDAVLGVTSGLSGGHAGYGS